MAKQTGRPNMKIADIGLSTKGFALQFLLLFLNVIKLLLRHFSSPEPKAQR